MERPLEQEIQFADRPRCPYCHDTIAGEGAKQGCGSCMAWHHAECWAEAGKCASCGAEGSSSVEGQGKPSRPPIPQLRMHLGIVAVSFVLALLEVLVPSSPVGPYLLVVWLVVGALSCWKVYGLLQGRDEPQPAREESESGSPPDKD